MTSSGLLFLSLRPMDEWLPAIANISVLHHPFEVSFDPALYWTYLDYQVWAYHLFPLELLLSQRKLYVQIYQKDVHKIERRQCGWVSKQGGKWWKMSQEVGQGQPYHDESLKEVWIIFQVKWEAIEVFLWGNTFIFIRLHVSSSTWDFLFSLLSTWYYFSCLSL